MADLIYLDETETFEYEIKWGQIPSVDAADPAIDMWNYGKTVPNYQFIPYDIDPITGDPVPGGEILYHSSSSSADNGKLIEVKGLEAGTGRIVLVTDTLDAVDGQVKTQFAAQITKINGRDLLPSEYINDFKFFRTFRATLRDQITTPGVERGNYPALAGNYYLYRDDTPVAGVPGTPANVQCYIVAGENQTQMLLYTTAFNAKSVKLKTVKCFSFKQNSTAVEFVLFLRTPFGGISKFPVFGGHSQGDNPDLKFLVAELGPGFDIWVQCNQVTTNGTGVSGFMEIETRLNN
jgi:hypothetical protein